VYSLIYNEEAEAHSQLDQRVVFQMPWRLTVLRLFLRINTHPPKSPIIPSSICSIMSQASTFWCQHASRVSQLVIAGTDTLIISSHQELADVMVPYIAYGQSTNATRTSETPGDATSRSRTISLAQYSHSATNLAIWHLSMDGLGTYPRDFEERYLIENEPVSPNI